MSVERPDRLVLVVGTGTEVGKTWVAARLLERIRARGIAVAARKPAQSFDADDDLATTDAAVLGRASGESPEVVCPPERWYPLAMAPPMAAAALGREPFGLWNLVGELCWPPRTELGIVESAGGVRSPQADDGDAVDLARLLAPDAVVLVADAGLGMINAIRLSLDALSISEWTTNPPIVVLNRFDPSNELHVASRRWLSEHNGTAACALPGEESVLSHMIVPRIRQRALGGKVSELSSEEPKGSCTA